MVTNFNCLDPVLNANQPGYKLLYTNQPIGHGDFVAAKCGWPL